MGRNVLKILTFLAFSALAPLLTAAASGTETLRHGIAMHELDD